jgi:hypothetical protein
MANGLGGGAGPPASRTRGDPTVAYLIRPWLVHYIDKQGRRCKKDAPGAKRILERASLTPESFDLDGPRPTATVSAAYDKPRRRALQRLPRRVGRTWPST